MLISHVTPPVLGYHLHLLHSSASVWIGCESSNHLAQGQIS